MKFNSLILAALLTGCATADEVKSLTEKVDALEKKVEVLIYPVFTILMNLLKRNQELCLKGDF